MKSLLCTPPYTFSNRPKYADVDPLCRNHELPDSHSLEAIFTPSKAVQGCVALRVLGRRAISTATIRFPSFNMVFPTIKLRWLRRIFSWLCALLIRWLRIGWRLAYQDPTPAWKKKGVVHFQSGLVDLALIAAVIGLALLSMYS